MFEKWTPHHEGTRNISKHKGNYLHIFLYIHSYYKKKINVITSLRPLPLLESISKTLEYIPKILPIRNIDSLICKTSNWFMMIIPHVGLTSNVIRRYWPMKNVFFVILTSCLNLFSLVEILRSFSEDFESTGANLVWNYTLRTSTGKQHGRSYSSLMSIRCD
jgi:hypothetical protein